MKKQKNLENTLQIQRSRRASWRKALEMAKELLGMHTPKKTVIISMMADQHIKVRTARNLYRDARNAQAKHKNRHMTAKEA